MSFGGDLKKFSEKTKITLDVVVRKVAIDLTTEIVRATPVDTGMAKNNWFLGTNRAGGFDPSLSRKGSASIQRAQSFASSLKAGGVFYITNNLPYILKLEFGGYKGPSDKVTGSGFSVQAPAGMARITVDRWQENVNRILRELR